MADSFTKSAVTQDVSFIYDSTGTIQDIVVRYLVTVTDTTTGAVYQATRGPFHVAPSSAPAITSAVQNGFVPPGTT